MQSHTIFLVVQLYLTACLNPAIAIVSSSITKLIRGNTKAPVVYLS